MDGILLRDGNHVPLTPKAFATLLALVEAGGHVVDKEELIRKVWPDTFVEEVNLAKNISYLRKILGEEESERFIETIPKRGYRFVMAVKETLEETPQSSPVAGLANSRTAKAELAPEDHKAPDAGDLPAVARGETLPARTRSSTTIVGWAVAVLAALLSIGYALFTVVSDHRAAPNASDLKIIPFTSYPGRETHPAFSPDGKQIAFVWDGESGDNRDIYVKSLEVGQPLRLTTDPAADSRPAWSPDGHQIAFLRQSAESSAYYVIPALGGPERKIAEVSNYQSSSSGNSQYYSPDGRFLASADKSAPEAPFSICFFSIETGEKRKVTSPPDGIFGDSYPAFSPDGKLLAFIRTTSLATTDLYVMDLPGGPTRRLTFDNSSIVGHAFTADGREIVFASRRGTSIHNLWRIPVAGGEPTRLPTASGQSVMSPSISPRGNYLAYTETRDDLNIWRLEIDSTGHEPALTRLIASTLFDNGPDYSPDGSKIVFASNRTGDFGIWTCDRDGANATQLVSRGPYLTGTPRWSFDGRRIAFDSRSSNTGQAGNADIYVVSVEGGPYLPLTQNQAENVAPSWSRNSQWIYFGSTQSGSMQVWKVPAAGGAPVQVTRQGGFEGFESVDGKTFYFAKGRNVPGIWQVPTGGGEEKLLFDRDGAGAWRLWSVVGKGIYFATATTPSHPMIEFYDFASGKVSQLARLDKPIVRSEPGLAVSPDGRSLLFTLLDQSGSDIMLMANFR